MLVKNKRSPLVLKLQTGLRTVEIPDTEEKGSHVRPWSHLILDGSKSEYELAVVVSHDSDLKFPVEMVRTRLGREIGAFDPGSRRSFEPREALLATAA